jgi:hypothetical protein
MTQQDYPQNPNPQKPEEQYQHEHSSEYEETWWGTEAEQEFEEYSFAEPPEQLPETASGEAEQLGTNALLD